jgi:putative intracellular protease/amidase
MKRGTATNDAPAFVVQDGNYVSARWPGDAYLFTRRFLSVLTGAPPAPAGYSFRSARSA